MVELRARLEQAKLSVDRSSTKARLLREELNEAKLAFADETLRVLRHSGGAPARAQGASYASVTRGSSGAIEGRAILVAKLDPSKADRPVDLSKVDGLLGSRKNGPVAQSSRPRNGQLVLTFNNEPAREAAKKILEDNQECKELFTSVSCSVNYFPVLIKKR